MTSKFFNLRFGDPGIGDAAGGAYLAAEGQTQPCCALCEQPMIPFLQFTLPAAAELPFAAGSRLSLLMCPQHNEIPSFETFETLPARYWERGDGHWYAALAPGTGARPIDGPRFIQPAQLVLSDTPNDPHGFIAVGGEPQWVQEPEHFTCCCGGPMRFVCQISETFEFPKLPEAPEQPDSPSSRGYVLFLGNEVYVLACERQCDPRAVWVTVQN